MRFDGAAREELEDALSDAFIDNVSVSAMLSHGFGSRFASRSAGMGLRERIFHVVSSLSAYDRHDQLVRVARRENPDNQRLRDLERKLGTSIRTEHLMTLENLLVTDQLNRDAILDAVNRFDVWSPLADPEDARTAFRRIVDYLASLPKQSNGTLPLSTFAKELATRVGREVEVRDWARSLPMGELQLAERKSVQALYLFVKCEPGYATSELGEVHVQMWLWRFDEHGVALDEAPRRVCDYTTVPFDQVPRLISDVRKRLTGELIAAKNNLSIALCLSQAALPVEVERWDIIVGTTPCPIGIKHPISLRSYERLYGGREDTWGQWASKWEQIKNGKGNLPVWWFDETISDTAFATAVHRPDMVCAALTHASGVSLVANTIDAGIPVVIWTRGSQHRSSEVKSRLEPLLAGCVADLPHRFHQRRGEPDPFDRIAILWEPYDRLPPDTLEFTAPERT